MMAPRLRASARIEWFIRISKVGNASLLVVEVLIILSNHEIEKNHQILRSTAGQ